MRNIFLLTLLNLASFSCAVAALAKPAPYPFRVIPKADCVATLQVAFTPESVIQDGLNALDHLDKSSVLSCVSEALTNWEQEYPARLVRTPDLLPKFGQHIADLQKQIECFNPWPLDSKLYKMFESNPPESCKGKVLDQEKIPALRAEYQRWMGISRLFSRMPEAFSKSYAGLADQLRAERERLLFCRPTATGASGKEMQQYQSDLQAHCGGKAMSSEENTAQQALVKELEQNYFFKNNAASVQAQKINELFGYSYASDALYEKMDQLLPLVKALACFKPKDGGAWWENDLKEPCDGVFGSAEDLPKHREALLSFLGNLDDLLAQARQEREARSLQHELDEAKLNEPRLQSYEGLRILLQYQAYLKRGGNPSALESFCAGYETQLQRDKQLAETSFGIYEKALPIKIEGEVYKKYAGDYGFTEGELGALSSYLGSFYRVINPALFKKAPPGPDIALYRDTLNSGLQKLPDYYGVVTRFADLPKPVLEQHKVGAVVTYDSFTSTSKAKNWKWEGNTKFLIYSKHKGKDVSDTNSAEQEVLFEAGTKFKVLERSKVGAITRIVLSEVEDKSEETKKGGKKK